MEQILNIKIRDIKYLDYEETIQVAPGAKGVSYVIFICTFDFFKKDRSVYELENICVDDANIRLNDGTHKIFLNTKGDRDGIGRQQIILIS